MATLVQTYDLKSTLHRFRLWGLLRVMTGLQWIYAGSILSIMIAAATRTTTLLLIGWFIDKVIPDPNLLQIAPLIGLAFIGLAVIEGSFSYLSGRGASYTAERVAWRVRNYLYDHLQRLTFTYHDKMQTGELIQRATSDIDAVRRFFIEQGVGLGQIIIFTIVNFTAIMFINRDLALLSIVVLPLLMALSLAFFRRIEKKYDEYQDQEAKLSTTLQEYLSGVRVVKAFARQEYEEQKFETENHKKYNLGRQLLMYHAYYWSSTDVVVGLQMTLGIFMGALLMLDGQITLGSFVAYLGMVGRLLNPMRQLGRLIVQATTSLVSYDRLAEIIREEREQLDELLSPPVTDLRGEIVFDQMSFAYDHHTPVLHDISLRVAPGETIAILGATGSGKTSLMGLLPRFYDYTGGSIRLDGHELRDYPRSFLRQQIGLVEQEPFLFSRTIRENITFGVSREVADEEIYAAARAAAIHDVIMGFPDGYETLVGERGVTLSGGQKQRTVLARTLLKNPKILILDDATSSVDTHTEAHIREALKNQRQDRTTFIIAHRIQTVMHADKIVVLDKGRIVQLGTHEELLAQNGIYKRTYELQAQIEAELEKELDHE